jgi:hypothetical protein
LIAVEEARVSGRFAEALRGFCDRAARGEDQ